MKKRRFIFSKIVNGRVVNVIEVVGVDAREATFEEMDSAVNKTIESGDREEIWLLKDTIMQGLHYGKHTYPNKMENMRKWFNKLEKALEKISSKREKKKSIER